MARGPVRVLRPRDDALPDAVARDALPRGRECEGLPGRPYPQDRLGENLGDDLGKGEKRAVEAAVPAAPRGGWPEAETISSMAADHGILAEDFFVTTWGLSWSESSWGFNKTIRTLCLPRFNRWAQSQNRRELVFSQEEIRKMTTHKMGRHVFGTVYAPQLPAKTLMEYMGITKFSVVQRYINFSKTEK